jgi:predicted  nucleic acid-binding Zn-ribbon protein
MGFLQIMGCIFLGLMALCAVIAFCQWADEWLGKIKNYRQAKSLQETIDFRDKQLAELREELEETKKEITALKAGEIYRRPGAPALEPN